MVQWNTPAVNARAEEILSNMTLSEKVAQMVQVPFAYVTVKAIAWAKRGAGSFLHVLGDDAREIQAAAAMSCLYLGIPVLFGIDAIHGHELNQQAVIFPSQLAAACSWRSGNRGGMGRVTAREVAADGLHWTFSPVLCVWGEIRAGAESTRRSARTRISQASWVPRLYAAIRATISRTGSTCACAKHYIGYGDAIGGRDSVDTEMTFRKLKETFLPPFARAVEAGTSRPS
ncbi:MAG: glycoside hydrolase family 3 N-terminal domain-containing protein [Eubacteriales bacterium]